MNRTGTNALLGLLLLIVALLACAEATPLPPKGPMPVGATWSGTYDTDHGTLRLTQQGNHVTGAYDYGTMSGTVDGTTDGNTLSFAWKSSDDAGHGTFVMKADGRGYVGSWGTGAETSDSGEWSGTKTADGPATTPASAPASAVVSASVNTPPPAPTPTVAEGEPVLGGHGKPSPEPTWPASTRLCKPADLADCDAQCKAGHGGACFLAGATREKTDATATAQSHERGCELGKLESCHQLAVMSRKGTGVPKDDARANTLFQKACDAGQGASCRSAGIAYRDGLGAAADGPKASAAWQRGCVDLEHPGCCYELGVFYSRGKLGTPKDPAKALSYYQSSCEKGAASGCTNLGVMHLQGEGTAKDTAKAMSLFGKGCDLHDPNGCANQGVFYRDGIGVPKDDELARQRFEQACALGSQKGCALQKALGP